MKNEIEAAWVKEFSKFIAKVEYRPTPDEIKSFIRTLLSSTEKATRERCAEELENMSHKNAKILYTPLLFGAIEKQIKNWRKEQER